MFVDTSRVTTSSGRTHTRYLLRESYREEGKVKHRTVANLSHCTEAEIGALKLALKHKGELQNLGNLRQNLRLRQGLAFGAVYLVHAVAEQLGIVKALGNRREGKFALWQVIARVINQGSRLSAVRLAGGHAACDVLGLDKFNEEDLYKNLDWISGNQSKIEDTLYERSKNRGAVFLYDVTSSYFEGTQNELSEFGYNRDKKRGERQIVIGLLCDENGIPLSIEVFPGNTSDTQTVASQVEKLRKRFNTKEVTFVGDRGMVKSQQVEDLLAQGFHYITAITKPQVEKLLRDGTFQLSLFEQNLAEISIEDGPRYVLRRNPVRGSEVAQAREDKLAFLRKKVAQKNLYLSEHPRANVDTALKAEVARAKSLGISAWCQLSSSARELCVAINEEAKKEAAKLDGCYVLKTDLAKAVVPKDLVHSRYKDLAHVEKAFRFSKTSHLEMRPIYLRLEERTKAHALVVMLAYRIIQHLQHCWRDFNLTVEEGIKLLSSHCLMDVLISNKTIYSEVPIPRDDLEKLFSAADVSLPSSISYSGVTVSTNKKLQNQRVS